MKLAPSNTAAILLAAGASSRFGGDKLSAPLRGGTVLGHSAAALAASNCALRALIFRPDAKETKQEAPTGFATIANPDAAQGLSTSIRAGVVWAEQNGAQGVLIALADMPLIPAAHFEKLFKAANKSGNNCAFTCSDQRRSPPALFGAQWFEQLKMLSGDSGARNLLADQPDASGVAAPEKMLTDIDTPDDLESLQD